MALQAVAFPILPGKTEQWRGFIAEMNGPRRAEYEAAQQRFGVHWRIFLQQTPQGDLVIATAEGADPARAFRQLGAGDDAFTQWWAQQIQDIHGVDLRQSPPGPLPELAFEFRPR